MKKIILVLIIVFVASCKPKERLITQERVTTEYRNRYLKDSVFFRDTTVIQRLGDTVYIDRVKWRERYVKDTINYVKVDSIPYRVEVPVEVNKLTKWQELRLELFNYIIVGIVIILLLTFYRGWKG